MVSAEPASKYAVIFSAKEARATDGTLITPKGRQFVVVKEADGWVPATSSIFNADRLPLDLKTWKSLAEAEKFMRKWAGHPWYASPETFKTVKVHEVYELKLAGYGIDGQGDQI